MPGTQAGVASLACFPQNEALPAHTHTHTKCSVKVMNSFTLRQGDFLHGSPFPRPPARRCGVDSGGRVQNRCTSAVRAPGSTRPHALTLRRGRGDLCCPSQMQDPYFPTLRPCGKEKPDVTRCGGPHRGKHQCALSWPRVPWRPQHPHGLHHGLEGDCKIGLSWVPRFIPRPGETHSAKKTANQTGHGVSHL